MHGGMIFLERLLDHCLIEAETSPNIAKSEAQYVKGFNKQIVRRANAFKEVAARIKKELNES